MIYYKYSPTQLEQEANKLNQEFDSERLVKPKSIDVYDVVDFMGCTPDWVYLSPDGTYLGMTAYNDGYWWAWPSNQYKKGVLPTKIPVYAGTILIDRTISEGDNRGIENFTVIHECFHQRLHKKCFNKRSANYQHFCEKKSFRAEAGNRKNMTAIEIIEYQANYCTAAFLMPREAVQSNFMRKVGLKALPNTPMALNYKLDEIISDMAELFSVNYTPMKYRLQTLNLISKETTPLDEYFCS